MIVNSYNAITLEAAHKLESKLLACDVPLAVFFDFGSWQVTKTNTKSFQELLRKTPDRLVGVYTAAVKLEDIAEDFLSVGIK